MLITSGGSLLLPPVADSWTTITTIFLPNKDLAALVSTVLEKSDLPRRSQTVPAVTGYVCALGQPVNFLPSLTNT